MKKRIIAMVLALALAISCVFVLASCGNDGAGEYTYKDAVTTMSTNWNPHTYQTNDESYPIDFITTGLYTFIFKKYIHTESERCNYSIKLRAKEICKIHITVLCTVI